MSLPPLAVALDLEFNQPSRRIIQIGAVIGTAYPYTLHGRFSVLVNPDEPLNPEIEKLCGLDNSVLACAGSLDEGYQLLVEWLERFGERQLNPLTWGGADNEDLRDAIGPDSASTWPFGRRHVDVKTVYTAWRHANGQEPQGGLKASMRKVGLAFEGRPHDATDDALNTLRMYGRLLELMQPAVSAVRT